MKNKRLRLVLTLILLLLVIGLLVGLSQWYKPHRSAASEKGISINPDSLVAFYSADEKAGDAKYLNKPLQVKGMIAKVDTNASGQTTVLFNSADPMSSVFCTMQEKGLKLEVGKEAEIKGFCSGHTTDVLLTDCVIVK